MGIFPVDEDDLFEPNLLVPGKKPIGTVQVADKYKPVRWVIFPENAQTPVLGTKQTPGIITNSSTTYNYPVVSAGNTFNTANKGMRFDNLNYYVTFDADGSVAANQDFTILVHFINDLGSGSYVYTYGSGGSPYLSIATRHTNVSFQWGAFVNSTVYGSGTTLSSGQEYVLLVRRSANTINFFRNGVKESGSATQSGAAGSSSAVVFNSYRASGGYGTQQTAFMAAFIDRALSDGGCIALTKNPYLLLEAA